MVALNKTYQKTLTPDRSAKDSGRRFYSPEISRWLSRDPVGARGGPNIYGFLMNRPTFLVDPIGLAARPIAIWDPPPPRFRRSGGQSCFAPAENVTFQGEVIGTVQVYRNATVEQRNTSSETYAPFHSDAIWLEFNRSQNSILGSCLDCNWLQFVLTRFYDAHENEVTWSEPIADQNVSQMSGQRYLDPASSSRPWATSMFIPPDQTVLLDEPGSGLSAEMPRRVSNFDSFLICRFQEDWHALFQVAWRMTQQFGQNRIYDNIRGTSISQLPSWASGERWLQGYDVNGNPVNRSNPLFHNP